MRTTKMRNTMAKSVGLEGENRMWRSSAMWKRCLGNGKYIGLELRHGVSHTYMITRSSFIIYHGRGQGRSLSYNATMYQEGKKKVRGQRPSIDYTLGYWP